jgi:hypothetical protein
VNLPSIYSRFLRGGDAETHLVASDSNDGNADFLIDDDPIADIAREKEHGFPSVKNWASRRNINAYRNNSERSFERVFSFPSQLGGAGRASICSKEAAKQFALAADDCSTREHRRPSPAQGTAHDFQHELREQLSLHDNSREIAAA